MNFKLKKHEGVPFESLNVGQTFMYSNELFIKIVAASCGGYIFSAVQLSGKPGNVLLLVEELVQPVNGTFVEEE